MVQIVDASVAIKWFVEEKGRDVALKVLQRLLENPKAFAVPEIFYFELVHVFHRLVPHPASDQLDLLATLITLGIHRFSMTPEFLSEIRSIQKLGLSGYDGAYVALAKLLQGRWLTFDEQAHRCIAHLQLSEVL